ncbi:hypothetical protein BGZ63DRAFT_191336 [Mariannaea sp. PMI_226]|nr:hypothetical protein BGZ63DRAFT_191336 [Mariannaea sp. PMI_226]
MHQVAYGGGGRVPRRTQYREDDRDWYPPEGAWAYSMPHPSHFHEVQRSMDRAPTGYGRAPRNSRSLDAFQHDMPPPHLTRGSTDPYRRPRRERNILVYQDEEEEPPDVWQRPRTRETTPEYVRPPRRAQRERRVRQERRRPQPIPPESSSESAPSTTESEDETSDSGDDIEVVELSDEEPEYDNSRHRRHRSRQRRPVQSRDTSRRHRSRNASRHQSRDASLHPQSRATSRHPQSRATSRHPQSRPTSRHQSNDDYLGSPDNRVRRRRSRRRRRASMSDEENNEVEYPHSGPEISEPPVTPSRQIVSRRPDSESPKYNHRSRGTSIVESPRPPVVSRRLVPGELVLQAPSSGQRARTIKIFDAQGAVYREGRPRRSASPPTREQSVSSSRRPPSLMGSNFGDSSRMSSPVRPANL